MQFNRRPYAGPDDLVAIQGLLAEGWRQFPHAGYIHRGSLEWRTFGPHGFRPEDIISTWEDSRGIAGWALLSSSEGFDYQVLPRYRSSPLEREIVEWGHEETLKWRAANGHDARCVVESYADDFPRINLLKKLGYRDSGRGSVYLRRRLAGPVDPPLPPRGWDTRGLKEADVNSRAVCQNQAFAPGSHTTPETWRSMMASAPSYDADLDSIAVTADGVVGAAALAWIDPVNKTGEFEPVGTHPDHRRIGLGRAVLLRGLQEMRRRGALAAYVGTNKTNEPAIALYRSVGFEQCNRFIEFEYRVA